MTGERQELLYDRLLRRLGVTEPDVDTELLLLDMLTDAECAIASYLGVTEVEERFEPKLLELAALYFRRNSAADPDARSISVTEGGLSQRVEYGDRDAQEQAILRSLARYRVVRL